MRRFAVGFVVTFGGCLLGPPTYIVPLAELDAELVMGSDNRSGVSVSGSDMLRLEELMGGRDHCRILSPRNSVAILDGSYRGELEPGGPESSAHVGDCYPPAFFWSSPPVGRPSTIEITDGSATWTFVIYEPFEYRRFDLISHDYNEPLRPGDTVVMRVTPSGTIANATVKASKNGMELFMLTESDGVTRTGDDLTFIMPMTPPATSVFLSASADFAYRIDRCDAPRGCKADYSVNSTDIVDIVAP